MQINLIKILLLVFIILFVPVKLLAQQTDTLNSPALNLIPSDSTQAPAQKKGSYDVDTTVFASSKDSLIFLVKEKKMKIFGSGQISYKQTEIKSANIEIDFDKSVILATGIPSDSVEGKFVGLPILKEGTETYEGNSMKYNFKTGGGIISAAQTEQEGSKYKGSKIKKVDKSAYFIEDGVYTTCEADCPHFYFTASKMKIIQEEQLVADWIFLHFGGVPFPVPLPFAVFPIESGRRSGIIAPVFGSDPTYGTYFKGFGYFWAINDYIDLNLTADYYTRGSYKFDSRFRYTKRYDYSGNLELSYGKFITGEETDANSSESVEWRVRWNHNQNITPTSRLDAKVEFISGSNINRNIDDFNEVLRNEAISNITYFKQWEESGNSLSLSYSRNQNFENTNISEVLPNLTFSLAQSYPFKSGSSDQAWYETFGYNYSGQLQNNRNKVEGDLQTRGGIQHNIRGSLSPKVGYFSISPNFNYNESWYSKRVTKYAAENDSGDYYVKTEDVQEINFVRTFSVGATASTKFYGMFNIHSLGIDAIRHTVTPSISYSYSPDYSTPFWGYYDTYTDSAGKEIEYNKFEKEIFVRPGNVENQLVSFSLGNVFEMKTTTDPTDTTSKQEKLQLLNLTAGLSYNFAADSLKFSDLNFNYRTQIGSIFSFNGALTLSPYSYTTTKDKIDKYLIDDGKGLLRVTNFFLSFSLSIAGDKISSTKSNQVNRTGYQQDQNLINSETSIYQGLYSDQDPDFSVPWDFTLNYNYNESRPSPYKITKGSNISGSVNFNLTQNWKFSATASYDLQRKEFAAPQIRISRDLHCWIMNFTWNPIGTYRGYVFEIRVKAPQLQDLKVTKRDQFYEGR
jgi:lipopolysaccharide assembly outer membrane protein LptD (OstA)